MCYLCSMLFNVDRNMQCLLTLLTNSRDVIYGNVMVLVCIQNCLSLKLANSLNPEFTLTLQGCYIIAMYSK